MADEKSAESSPAQASQASAAVETEKAEAKPFNLTDWTKEQRDEWRRTGEPPKATKADPPPDGPSEPKKPEKPKLAQRNSELEAENERLKANLAERNKLREELAKQEPKEAPAKQPKRPTIADFDDYTKYEQALEEWHDYRAEQKYLELDKKRTAEAEERESQKVVQDQAKDFVKARAAVVERVGKAEWLEAEATAIEALKKPHMAESAALILESPAGPEIFYRLGSDPEKLAELLALPPAKQIRMLTLMETELGGTKPKEKAKAEPKRETETPKPAKDIQSRTLPSTDPVREAVADGNWKKFKELKLKELQASGGR